MQGIHVAWQETVMKGSRKYFQRAVKGVIVAFDLDDIEDSWLN